MIPSSHSNPRNKAITEVLAMIANAHPETMAVHESNDFLWEDATEFCAALERLSRESLSVRSARRMHARRSRYRNYDL